MDNEHISFFVGVVIGAVISIFIMMSITIPKQHVVAHGCAYYDKESYDFTWKINE